MDLSRFPLSDEMRLALYNNNLSYAEEIMLISSQELSKKLGIDLSICQKFHEMVALAILPRPIEYSNNDILQTGLQSLDELGGIPKGQLFEIFGEAGGKFHD